MVTAFPALWFANASLSKNIIMATIQYGQALINCACNNVCPLCLMILSDWLIKHMFSCNAYGLLHQIMAPKYCSMKVYEFVIFFTNPSQHISKLFSSHYWKYRWVHLLLCTTLSVCQILYYSFISNCCSTLLLLPWLSPACYCDCFYCSFVFLHFASFFCRVFFSLLLICILPLIVSQWCMGWIVYYLCHLHAYQKCHHETLCFNYTF